MMIEDQRNEVRTMSGNQVRIVIEVIAVTGGGITIIGTEIVTGIMTAIVGMIVSITGIDPAVMNPEVVEGRVHGQRNVRGIMTVTGGMIGTRSMLVSRYENLCYCLGQ